MLIDDLNNGHYDYEEFLEDAALLREVLDAVDGSKGPVAGLFDEDGTRLLGTPDTTTSVLTCTGPPRSSLI